ncbi:hypothetical protein QMK87_09945, partial [Klebsiella pneumoniae]
VGHLFMFLVGGKTPDQSVHLNLTTTEGEQVVIGGNERYVSVCRKHYKEALSVGSLTKVQNQHRPC